MEKIIGIDLGTSNSACAVMSGGKVVVVPSAEGTTLMGKAFPSVVAFTRDGQVLAGEPARRQMVSNPEGTVTAFKRKMGTDHKYRVWGREYTPQEISAILLRKIKRDAEAFLGEPVKKAVITVPAYFNDNQRQATKEAGTLAGLEVVRIINEPTAASLAYGLDKAGEHRIMVFDLGGGTLDVTILEFGGGVFEVKSTSGDTQLGGTDMDKALMDYLLRRVKAESGLDLAGDRMAMARLAEAAEKAKIELSAATEVSVDVPFLATKPDGEPYSLSVKLSRETLESLVQPIIERCRQPVLRALADAKLKPQDVQHVILVGGPTRMPVVRRFIGEIMGREAERGIDPMECVAIGAAIQGAVLAGELQDILLLDVTPLSLGIETFGGLMNVIIPRNTTIPTKAGEVFTTAVDNQTKILIHVLQGEREFASDNFSLGKFSIDVEPAPAGVPRIGVQFTIDADGILHVLARDIKTGKDKVVSFKSAVDVSDEQVERMVRESVEHALEDMRRRQLVEAKMAAEQAISATFKGLEQFGAQISEEEKLRIQSAVGDLKRNLDSEDPEAIRAAIARLDQATQRLAEIMVKETAQKFIASQSEGGGQA